MCACGQKDLSVSHLHISQRQSELTAVFELISVYTHASLTCKRSFSSALWAVSLRVATRSQNFLSMATMFSATSRASCERRDACVMYVRQ